MPLDDDAEDRLYRLREENFALKKQAKTASNNVKLLTSKLSRLLEEKKNLVKKEKIQKQINLEESLQDQELTSSLLASENRRLRQSELLLRTKLESNRQKQYQRSPYSHVRSRTDSGLNQDFSYSDIALHHRSYSSASLNRVTFTSTNGNPIENENENKTFVSGNEIFKKRPYTGKRNFCSSGQSVDGFAFQLLKESQEEICQLREIVTAYQKQKRPEHSARELCEKGSQTENEAENDEFKSFQRAKDEPKGSRMYVLSAEKSLQLFDPELKTSSKAIDEPKLPEEVSFFVKSMSQELSSAKEVIKTLEKQIISDRSISNQIQQLEKKIENLNQENELLRKSLDSCINICVSDIIKGSLEYSEKDGENVVANDLPNQTIACVNRVNQLEFQQNQIISEVESQALRYRTLESKYEQLNDSYNSLASKSINNGHSIPAKFDTNNNKNNGSDLLQHSSNRFSDPFKSEASEMLGKVREEQEAILKNSERILSIIVKKVRQDSES